MKFLVAAILLTAIAGIAGLECYTCTSGSGASTGTNACNDPFNTATTDPNVLKLNCQAGFDVCAKTMASSGGQTLVARSCFTSAACAEQNGCATGSYQGVSATICCCNGNLCNGAGSVTVSVIPTMVVVVMAMMFSL